MTLAPAAFPLPRGFDKAAAALAQAHFSDKGAAERSFAESAEGVSILEALGGHSPYLADLAVRESATLLFMAERGPDEAFARTIDPLTRLDPATPRSALATLLRQAKRQGALVAALADIRGLWGLDRVTGALSELAELSIDTACAHLLRDAAARGDLRHTGGGKTDAKSIGRQSGLVIPSARIERRHIQRLGPLA